MERVFVRVKGRGKKPHVWDLLKLVKMYAVCPALRIQE